MTTSTVDQNKRNAVIMGRRTYFGIPPNKRPLPNRLNVVLSNNSTASDYPADVVLCKSLSQAINQLSETDLGADIESIWICGGYSVYKEAMTLDECHRVYFTEIKAKFDCDAFFPDIPSTFTIVPNDDDIPSEEQEENGLKYQYKIYEKVDQWNQGHSIIEIIGFGSTSNIPNLHNTLFYEALIVNNLNSFLINYIKYNFLTAIWLQLWFSISIIWTTVATFRLYRFLITV